MQTGAYNMMMTYIHTYNLEEIKCSTFFRIHIGINNKHFMSVYCMRYVRREQNLQCVLVKYLINTVFCDANAKVSVCSSSQI